MVEEKMKQLPLNLSKVIEDNIRQVEYFSKVVSGELELPSDGTATIYRIRRVEEMGRFVNALEESFNLLDEEMKELVRLYFWGGEKITLDGVAQKLYISSMTARRWKKLFITLVALRLGQV